jgi:hypothetical protein
MKGFEAVGYCVVLMFVVAVLGLLVAFPFSWAWNYAMPAVFGLPKIDWLTAFCLLWISHCVFPNKILKAEK